MGSTRAIRAKTRKTVTLRLQNLHVMISSQSSIYQPYPYLSAQVQAFLNRLGACMSTSHDKTNSMN